jgi:hypothetical protein
MKYLYHAEVEIAYHVAMTATQMGEMEYYCKRKLANEFLPFIEQNMVVSRVATNPHAMTETVRGSMVMMPLEEYNKLMFAAQQSDIRYRGLDDGRYSMRSENVFRPQPKKEFDAVDYLKNLMKKPR